MMTRLRILLIRLFSPATIKTDRKIIELLSREIHIKKKYHLQDFLFETLDGYKKTKSRTEFVGLVEIMKAYITKGFRQKLATLSNEYKELLWPHANEELRLFLRISDN